MNRNLRSLPDKELIDLFKNGNADAFGVLVEKYTQTLSGTLFHLLKDPMLVEDFLQDTFIRAMTTIQKENYEDSGTFKAWLIRIGHNLVIDHFRAKKRRSVLNIPSTDGPDGNNYFVPLAGHDKSPEDDIISTETDYDIQVLMDELDPDQREVINLRHFHGFSFKEIADFIGDGISINTVLGRMRYGLINLRKRINEVKNEGQKIM
jgi:RNA polymerase sigma-70 factor (ECF subfamily)